MNTFEEFLQEKHSEQYTGLDDGMIDDFQDWIVDLEPDDWIKLGDEYAKKEHEALKKGECMFKDFGEIELKGCDDANVPVQCFLSEPKENSDGNWHWTANNYMPRKNRISEGSYEIVAKTKEEILQAIGKFVIPLYQIAIDNLKTTGELYYWRKDK